MKIYKKIALAGLCAAMVVSATSCASVSYNFNLSEYVTVGEYKGLEITTDEINASYDATIEQLQSDNTKTNTITDRGAQAGDVLSVDYTLSVGDTQIDMQSAYSVTLGSGKEQYEDALVGAASGASVTSTVTLPDDYTKADYAGVEATYSITVKSITEYDVPTIDYDFINEKYPDKYSSFEDFSEQAHENVKKDLLWQTVTESSKVIKYPEDNIKVYYNNYVKYYNNMYQSYANQMNTTLDQVYSMLGTSAQSIYSQAADAAKDDVKKELIALYIAELENITLDDETYNTKLEEMYSTYGYDSAKAMEKAVGKDAAKRLMTTSMVIDLVNDNSVEK